MTAILTAQTCGEACWEAREDVCRCSCGGANHGIRRTPDGEQPIRTRRIQGATYQVRAIESCAEYRDSCRATSMRPIERLASSRCIVKAANLSEVDRWPELAAWRGYADKGYGPLIAWELIP